MSNSNATYFMINFGYDARGRAKNRHYDTMDEAKAVAEAEFKRSGVVLSITASPRKPKSFKLACKDKGATRWVYNGVRLATVAETESYGSDLYSRWMGLDKWEVHASSDPVNYEMKGGRAVPKGGA